ncbi:MAG: YchJ family protein [Desulfuromonadales bacterium]|nr:YchJ family protein [Desulfuromonadales bacterium]
MPEICPCGTGKKYNSCCQPFIKGKKKPETAEQLMRARYSAYVNVETDYLFASTHPSYRDGYDHDGTKKWAENSSWEGLEIVKSQGGPEESVGEVEFIAHYKDGETEHAHHELGKFRKKDGEWFLVEGKLVGAMPATSNKIGRNEPCPCGSGLKYKKCCGK